MIYDFDTPVNRRNTDSVKWAVKENELPMWIADMDFEVIPQITEAIKKRADEAVYGYPVLPEEWYNAYISWWKRRHNFTIEKDWLIFSTSVVAIVSSAVRKLTTPAENVLLQTPVYNIFFNSIVNNGRNVLESPLRYENNIYSIDFERLEKDLSNPQTSMMILCNPQNPTGNIWSKEELQKIGELCKKYGVTVISDEIHCDLTCPEKLYIPFASVSDTCRDISVNCVAPTKAFNIAGIMTAATFIPNPVLRHKVWRALNTDEVAEPNIFATISAIEAFNNGDEWLDQLRKYVCENKKYVCDRIAKEIPHIKAHQSEATYLLWIDCSALKGDKKDLSDRIREKTGLFVSAGHIYGEMGRDFLRMNLATSRKHVEDGVNRLIEAIKAME